MNLYSKIYNAVNEGIQKALLIDPEQNDVSINYSYSKISNNTNLMPLYVNDFLEVHTVDNIDQAVFAFNQIQKLNNENNYFYKVKDISELNKIYKQIEHVNACANQDFRKVMFANQKYWLNWIDTTDALTFIMDNDRELPLHKINENNEANIRFIHIKLKEIENSGNDIIIYIDEQPCIRRRWKRRSGKYTNKKVFDKSVCKLNNYAQNDYNGYDNTYNNPNIRDITDQNDFSNFPIFNYANYASSEDINDYSAYIPSLGQMIIIMSNLSIISYICKQYFNETIYKGSMHFSLNDWGASNYFWTSTECDMKTAYTITNDFKKVDKISVENKTNEFQVFLLYKKRKTK